GDIARDPDGPVLPAFGVAQWPSGDRQCFPISAWVAVPEHDVVEGFAAHQAPVWTLLEGERSRPVGAVHELRNDIALAIAEAPHPVAMRAVDDGRSATLVIGDDPECDGVDDLVEGALLAPGTVEGILEQHGLLPEQAALRQVLLGA